MHFALREFFAFLMCGALATPQLVSERSAIVLAVSFLSNLLRLAYLLVRILWHMFLVNTTVQCASHMVPTPTSVLVKEGIIYPVVGKSDTNWGIGSIAVSDNFSTCPFAVPTLIVEALV